jgi:hypothetical protein
VTGLLPWLSLAILFAIIAGFAFLYIRHGAKIRRNSNRRHEDGLKDTIGSESGSGND